MVDIEGRLRTLYGALPGPAKAAYRTLRAAAGRDPDAFFRRCAGVIHVGAHIGQERARYAALGLEVLWIEPIPEVFEQLQRNLEPYPEQRALQCLLSEADGKEVEFHVSNNAGQSSSMLELKDHAEIWPDVRYVRTLTLNSRTLPALLEDNGIDPGRYDALVLDTQGSELLVLQGAAPLLHRFRFIKAEAANFEAYAGCCTVSDLRTFLAHYRFRESARRSFAGTAKGQRYYDIVFRRRG
jgi:FkbM family methyltransferase